MQTKMRSLYQKPKPLIVRTLEETLVQAAKEFPAVGITGPRQSGKTTLVRMAFPDKEYVTLEDLETRQLAEGDPKGFLSRYPDGAILDEVQRVPHLFSYLQGILDDSRETGRFILTGSQQFGLITGVTQSLAGRIAMLTLLPFSLEELNDAGRASERLDQLLFQGSYPPLYDRVTDFELWFQSYTNTYVERDVRLLTNVRDLSTFFRFVQLCAGRSAQLLNSSSLAGDLGVSHETIRSWISILEASHIIHLLQPHHRNFNKRMIKSPKLYFHDTGLLCYLLGVASPEQLNIHQRRGAIFETWVVSEMLKHRLHRGKRNNLYFWRDRAGNEVDVLVDEGARLMPVEVKSGQTIASDFDKGLNRWLKYAGNEAGPARLVYGGERSLSKSGVHYISWRDLPRYAG